MLSKTPSWTDLNAIIKDLRIVFDAIESRDESARSMRAAIARAMAQMREEKATERQVEMVHLLLKQLTSFKIQDAGVVEWTRAVLHIDMPASRHASRAST
nr:hypothetical protein [Candidatus Sigynarchaeota archaeon]